MMLALWEAVTRARPCSLAHVNANRTIRSEAGAEISLTEMPLSGRTVRPFVAAMNEISASTSGVSCSSSRPVYIPSVFSRTTTRSTSSYRDGTPGYR